MSHSGVDDILIVTGFEKERIEKAVRDILEAIGEDPNRDGLKGTPNRVARMYSELFSQLQHQEI